MKKFSCSSIGWLVFSTVSLASISACGDIDTFRISPGGWGDTAAPTSWEGTLLHLIRATPSCDLETSQKLISLVGDHMEFSSEDVAGLKSACSNGPEAEVSIDVEGRSIVYDFSHVVGPRKFAAGGFNGYIFADALAAAPEVLRATVDRDATTLDLDDSAFRVDGHVVLVNFEGIEFDESTFIKLDLTFANPEGG